MKEKAEITFSAHFFGSREADKSNIYRNYKFLSVFTINHHIILKTDYSFGIALIYYQAARCFYEFKIDW